MAGLMRYQLSGLSGPASSKSKRSSGSRLFGTPGLALLCIAAGYILGCCHAPRIDPYPIDMVRAGFFFEPSQHIRLQIDFFTLLSHTCPLYYPEWGE
jgi:hypothetical protein